MELCCSTKLYGEKLQENGLQAVSCSKTFQAHRLLNPAPCLDDLLYLTALVAFVLPPTPCGNFQRSFLEWCCNSFRRAVVYSGRNFVETKLKFLARTLLVKFSDFNEKMGKETVQRFLRRNILHWPSLVYGVAPASPSVKVSFRLLCCVAVNFTFV